MKFNEITNILNEQERIQGRVRLLNNVKEQLLILTKKKLANISRGEERLFSEDHIQSCINHQHELEIYKYNKGLREGKENNDLNREGGIVVRIFKNKVLNHTMKKVQEYEIQTKEIEDDNNLLELHIPYGTYTMGGGACQFYADTRPWKEGKSAEQPFILEYDDILRVESSSGKVWHNYNHNELRENYGIGEITIV